jgi:AcrR family transcriptional regulator
MTTLPDAVSLERLDTRAALVEAAATLLATRGMAAVTLRAVGERSGVSRTTPYRHFADKEALLAAVAAAAFVQLGTRMTTAAATAHDPYRRLEAMVLAYVQFGVDIPAWYRLMFGPELRRREHAEVQVAARGVHGLLLDAVSAAQHAEQLVGGDATDIAALLYATAHGGVDLTLTGHVEAAKGLGDPVQLIRMLLTRLHTA